jgi:hypothetical protein
MIRTFYRILVATLALGAAVALSQSVALADGTLTFTGTTGLSLGGENTSPYVFNINNVNTPVLLACDDFYSHIWVGDSWTANRISLAEAGGTNGQGKFAYQNGFDSQEYYNEAGWLAQQLMSTRDPLLSEQYSWAIWEIFALGTPGGTNIASANLGSDDYDAVKNLIVKAYSAVQAGADLSDVYVYTPVLTPDGLASGPNNGTPHTAQEFFFVPEASTPAFLVFNLLALPGVLFLLRRRCLRG